VSVSATLRPTHKTYRAPVISETLLAHANDPIMVLESHLGRESPDNAE